MKWSNVGAFEEKVEESLLEHKKGASFSSFLVRVEPLGSQRGACNSARPLASPLCAIADRKVALIQLDATSSSSLQCSS